jgi:hypothetical protein
MLIPQYRLENGDQIPQYTIEGATLNINFDTLQDYYFTSNECEVTPHSGKGDYAGIRFSTSNFLFRNNGGIWKNATGEE